MKVEESTTKISVVDTQLQALEQSLAELEEGCTELRKRLTPVLHKEAPDHEKLAGESDNRSPLCLHLRLLKERVEGLRTSIVDTLERLEI